MRSMRIPPDDARARLAVHDHGVLCTLHPERGVDAVPVVYALDDEDFLGIPVDRVKPKTTTRLRRADNLDLDPRAALLVERWDREDWSRLWWVRAQLRYVREPSADLVDGLGARLESRYPQYAGRPFAGMLVLQVVGLTGWAASEGG